MYGLLCGYLYTMVYLVVWTSNVQSYSEIASQCIQCHKFHS